MGFFRKLSDMLKLGRTLKDLDLDDLDGESQIPAVNESGAVAEFKGMIEADALVMLALAEMIKYGKVDQVLKLTDNTVLKDQKVRTAGTLTVGFDLRSLAQMVQTVQTETEEAPLPTEEEHENVVDIHHS